MSEPEVRGCGVQRVEDLEFQRLPWPDVGDEVDADAFEGRQRAHTSPLEHPLGERLGTHGPSVFETGARFDPGPEFVVGRWHHPVNHARREADVLLDPAGQCRVGMLGELGHHSAQRVPVGREVVEADDGHRRPAVVAPVASGENEMAGKRPGLVRVRHVVDDVGQRGVEASGRRVPAVSLLGHRHRDERHRRERRAQFGRLGRGVEDGVYRADHPGSHVVAVDDAERVEPVLRLERALGVVVVERHADDAEIVMAGGEQIVDVNGEVGPSERAEAEVDDARADRRSVVARLGGVDETDRRISQSGHRSLRARD